MLCIKYMMHIYMRKGIDIMKKVLILIFALFLSGCTATYEVNIKDDKVIEKLTLIETDITLFDKQTDTGWTLRETFDSLVNHENEFSNDPYKVKSLNNNERLGVEYTSSSAKSILNSSILNQCYINPSVVVIDEIVEINTGTNFKCYEYYDNLDTIKVIFKTNHEVISTNATEKNGNTYIWNFTKDSNKDIKISYYENVVNNSNSLVFIFIIVIIVLIVGSGIYLLSKKINKTNSF